MVTLDSRILIPADVLYHEVQDELVLLDLRGETYYGLDTTGVRIWQLLVQGEAPRQILGVLQKEYDTTPERLQADVLAFLAALANAGLIQIHEPS